MMMPEISLIKWQKHYSTEHAWVKALAKVRGGDRWPALPPPCALRPAAGDPASLAA